jgi:tetratricopeptide (TPR) repeat protein
MKFRGLQMCTLAAYFLCMGLCTEKAAALDAQDLAQDPGAKPTPGTQDQPAKPPAKPVPNKDSAASSAPDQPIYDPLRAEKDLEVGQYYMRKGDVDAAIDRFEDAAIAKPGYAVPYRFLGEAQEKKGLKKKAIKSFQRYLDLYPHAEDGDKVRKRIEKLRKEVEKEAK